MSGVSNGGEGRSTPSVPQTVHWEDDPSRTRMVKRLCRSCRWVPIAPLVRLVSPQGVAHEIGNYMNEGHTACGKDATGPEWWWRT